MKKKVCFKCVGDPQPLSAFYKHAMMADGHLNKCKECTKRDVNERAQREPEKIAAYERKRWERPARKKAVRDSLKAARKKDPERFNKYSSDSIARYPERRKARRKLAYAVFVGKIKKPRSCPGCKKRKPVQAHHDDYSKPLDVRWLCTTCHGLEHRVST